MLAHYADALIQGRLFCARRPDIREGKAFQVGAWATSLCARAFRRPKQKHCVGHADCKVSRGKTFLHCADAAWQTPPSIDNHSPRFDQLSFSVLPRTARPLAISCGWADLDRRRHGGCWCRRQEYCGSGVALPGLARMTKRTELVSYAFCATRLCDHPGLSLAAQ
jgi:hypothetical protein